MNRIVQLFTSALLLAALVTISSHMGALAANGTVNARETHQTMEGFGASIAWADDQLASHPRRNEIYDYLFNDLGLDILRIRTTYVNNVIQNASAISQIVSAMKARSSQAKIMLAAWTPPYNLKSNNSQNGLGTLKKENGQFVYGAFAQTWVNALNAYKAIGIEPDYMSIQNEPNYGTTQWETCFLDPTENSTNAGYDRALDTVYQAMQQLGSRPKLLGPEVLGIGYNAFQNYAQRFNHNQLDIYAYHLYHGESDNINDNHNPDLFIPNLRVIATNYPGKPIFQTEYDRGDWFKTVWLIQNCIVHGNLSSYSWWELVWGSGGNPLIEMQSSSYRITDFYWAFRQYSKFVSYGWKRVTAASDADSLRMSAFISPEGNSLTIVILNIGAKSDSINFDIQNFNIANGIVVRTSNTEKAAVIDSNYHGTSGIQFPARSITTMSFSGTVVTGVEVSYPPGPTEFALYENYPNPFNPMTTIRYSLPQNEHVNLNVYDLLGQEVATLVSKDMPAGTHDVSWNAQSASSGVYFCRMAAGKFSKVTRMLVLK
jgi:glucuronoarabinoxylan endo-1,4-beta-xylanase